MKHNYLAITVLLSIFSAVSCFGQLTNESMMIGAENRTYKQYLPAGLDPENEEPSLLIILHGLGGSANDMTAAGFNFIADTARVVAIYPQGLPNGWSQNSWNNGTLLASTANDLDFFHALIDEAITEYNVNPARVYITGFSMGSIMSYHMACEMNNRVAAIGCMAGTMPTSDINSCNPDYATPVIHLHGTADGTVPYNGSALPSLSLVPETMNFWKNVHSCDATADSLRLPDTANDNITVDRFRYDNCDPNGSVELWRFNGADHIYLYQPVNDITEMIEVWLFLRRWEHSDPMTLGIASNKESGLVISPNPSKGVFELELPASSDFTVHTMDGTLVLNGTFEAGKQQIDLNKQPEGMYLLTIGAKVYKLIKQ